MLFVLSEEEHNAVIVLVSVERYQRSNHKPQIEDGYTMQWAEDKGQTLIYKTLHRKSQQLMYILMKHSPIHILKHKLAYLFLDE
jgi:hypothetical protein